MGFNPRKCVPPRTTAAERQDATIAAHRPGSCCRSATPIFFLNAIPGLERPGNLHCVAPRLKKEMLSRLRRGLGNRPNGTNGDSPGQRPGNHVHLPQSPQRGERFCTPGHTVCPYLDGDFIDGRDRAWTQVAPLGQTVWGAGDSPGVARGYHRVCRWQTVAPEPAAARWRSLHPFMVNRLVAERRNEGCRVFQGPEWLRKRVWPSRSDRMPRAGGRQRWHPAAPRRSRLGGTRFRGLKPTATFGHRSAMGAFPNRGAMSPSGIAERWQRLAMGVNPWNDCGQRFGAAERRQRVIAAAAPRLRTLGGRPVCGLTPAATCCRGHAAKYPEPAASDKAALGNGGVG